MQVKTANNGGISAEQIAMWKSKYRKVYEVVVEDDGEYFAGYFRRPDADTLAATTTIAQKDGYKGMSVMFDNCWLGGDPIIKEDAVIRLAAMQKLDVLVTSASATLKNL